MTACTDSSKAIQLAETYNKTVRYLEFHVSEIRYVPPPGNHHQKVTRLDLRSYRAICFTHDGFPTLHGEQTIE